MTTLTRDLTSAVWPNGSGTVNDNLDLLAPTDTFPRRHLGPRPADLPRMLEAIGVSSLDELINQTVPAGIRLHHPLALDPPRSDPHTDRKDARLDVRGISQRLSASRTAPASAS